MQQDPAGAVLMKFFNLAARRVKVTPPSCRTKLSWIKKYIPVCLACLLSSKSRVSLVNRVPGALLRRHVRALMWCADADVRVILRGVSGIGYTRGAWALLDPPGILFPLPIVFFAVAGFAAVDAYKEFICTTL